MQPKRRICSVFCKQKTYLSILSPQVMHFGSVCLFAVPQIGHGIASSSLSSTTGYFVPGPERALMLSARIDTIRGKASPLSLVSCEKAEFIRQNTNKIVKMRKKTFIFFPFEVV